MFKNINVSAFLSKSKQTDNKFLNHISLIYCVLILGMFIYFPVFESNLLTKPKVFLKISKQSNITKT